VNSFQFLAFSFVTLVGATCHSERPLLHLGPLDNIRFAVNLPKFSDFAVAL